MGGTSRRTFLRGVAAAGAVGWAPSAWNAARAAGLRSTGAVVVDGAGTSLESTVARVGNDGGYTKLGVGPGWPIVTRDDLAAPQPGREDRRRPIATIGHLSDIHLVDVQSPGRVEFTDRLGPPFESAFRAHEALSTQVGSAMVTALNRLRGGPVAGRALDCVVSTGDSIDNQQLNELHWFITLLDGGRLVPDSGTIGRYEGVQDVVPGSYDPHYWHPDRPAADGYGALGFPEVAGLLDAAIAPFDAPGVGVPWYSTYGNHDGLIQGNVNGRELGIGILDPLLTGAIKPVNLSVVPSPAQVQALLADPTLLLEALTSQGVPVRIVGADPSRRAVSHREWVAAHLASPTGTHGFTEAHLGQVNVDYTFPVAPGVLGIGLDTCNHGGTADGSLGASQLVWLEARLQEAGEQLVLLFSHHNLGTLSARIADPEAPLDPRMGREALLAVLRRFPNVVGWINGHTHQNRVTPVPDPSGATGGFWEITSASHIDYPEQARVVELVDNGDGTLSFFATVLEHAGPAVVDLGDRSALGLAALSRELAANDPQVDGVAKLGTALDLNVELVLRNPRPTAVAPPAPTTATVPGPTLPTTGGGASLLGPAAVAVGAALALRGRADRAG